MIDKMREDFEKWWRSEMNVEVMDLHRCEFPMQQSDFVQPYACHETQRCWLSWQASREKVVVELPNPSEGNFGWMLQDFSVQRAIESAGLKWSGCERKTLTDILRGFHGGKSVP